MYDQSWHEESEWLSGLVLPPSIIEELGFPNKFVNCVFSCVTMISFSISVNGDPLKPFKATKGLRQGDPLSPYLFTLCMEYLSRLLRLSCKDPKFFFYPWCQKVGLTQLLFTDDLLMFCKADFSSMATMMHTFQSFSRASGLEVNEGKSNVYIVGVTTNEKTDVMGILGMPEGAFPFRYLGSPTFEEAQHPWLQASSWQNPGKN